MKVFFDFLSLVLFYLAYQFYEYVPHQVIHFINTWLHVGLIPEERSNAIYFAIVIGITAAGLQTLFHWAVDGKPSTTHVLTFFAFLLLGGITLLLRDPQFIKWKPTIVNAIIAGVFFASTIIGNKSLVERIMGNTFQAPTHIWYRLTVVWSIFFLFIAILNLVVAYKFSESTWVNFKLFGILGLTFGFLLVQAIYLSRHLPIKNK